MNNVDIREYAKQKRVYLWEVAEKLGMKDSNLSKLMRKELPNERKSQIIEIIDALAATRA